MYSRKEQLFMWSIAFLCVAIVGLSGIIVYNLQPNKLIDVQQNKLVPTFQRGDCFNGTWEKEIWEDHSTPDGMVEKVGKNHYLVLFRDAAEKRGGAKYASSLSVVTFDKNHVKTECPKTWMQHTHK